MALLFVVVVCLFCFCFFAPLLNCCLFVLILLIYLDSGKCDIVFVVVCFCFLLRL